MTGLPQIKAQVIDMLSSFSGTASLYFKDIESAESYEYNSLVPMNAASVIKIPIMIELFNRIEKGEISGDEAYILKESDKMPSCGCLNMMHNGLSVTLLDLCSLMIILSDNSATNILAHRLGIENINCTMAQLGLAVTRMGRPLFAGDDPLYAGKRNIICAGEIGRLLCMMQEGTLISKEASRQMLFILGEQRLGSKIPMLLPRDMPIAHKTGETDDTSHDCGIVYAKKPFVLSVCGNPVDPIEMDKLIASIAKLHFDLAGGLPDDCAG